MLLIPILSIDFGQLISDNRFDLLSRPASFGQLPAFSFCGALFILRNSRKPAADLLDSVLRQKREVLEVNIQLLCQKRKLFVGQREDVVLDGFPRDLPAKDVCFCARKRDNVHKFVFIKYFIADTDKVPPNTGDLILL